MTQALVLPFTPRVRPQPPGAAAVQQHAVSKGGVTMRNQQVIHQWQMLKALQTGPKTIGELAAVAECCRRNVFRHLEALQAAGFPLFSQRHEDGAVRWHLLQARVPERRAA